MANKWGNSGQTLFLGAPKSLQMVSATMKLKDACSLEERASLVAQMVKSLPAMQETRVWFLGGEDPLEKEMAAHSSTLAWKIPWMEEPGGLQSMGSQRIGHDWVTSLSFLSFRVKGIHWGLEKSHIHMHTHTQDEIAWDLWAIRKIYLSLNDQCLCHFWQSESSTVAHLILI